MATYSPPEPRWITAWTGGRRKLGRDPVFGPWVRKIGTIRLVEPDEEPFFHLARTICYQQLAGNAAATIHGRFVEALGGRVTPKRVLSAPETRLREAGLSRNKLAAIRDLADKIHTGEVEVHDLKGQPDDEVVRRLTMVKGIGAWTAQMYLMFRLMRPDACAGDTVVFNVVAIGATEYQWRKDDQDIPSSVPLGSS